MGRDPTKLTTKQELFVQGLIKGLSQRKAYIKAGYSTKGKNDNVMDVNASKLFKNTKIALRYDELMAKHEKKALWTREMAIDELKKALTISTEDRTMNTLISAVKELNSLEDLYPKNKEEDKVDNHISDLRSKHGL